MSGEQIVLIGWCSLIGAVVGSAFGWAIQRFIVGETMLAPGLRRCHKCGSAVRRRCVNCFGYGKLIPPQGGSATAPPQHKRQAQ